MTGTKTTVQSIVTKLLFLTPFGYLWAFVLVIKQNSVDAIGLKINFGKPLTITIKENPSPTDRINWFFNGISMFIQVTYLIFYRSELFYAEFGKIVGYYAALTMAFALAQIGIAVFPYTNWNRKIF